MKNVLALLTFLAFLSPMFMQSAVACGDHGSCNGGCSTQQGPDQTGQCPTSGCCSGGHCDMNGHCCQGGCPTQQGPDQGPGQNPGQGPDQGPGQG